MDVDIKSDRDMLDATDTTCSICYAEFLDTDDLNLHMMQHSRSNSKNYCNTCNQCFTDMENYSLHVIKNHIQSASTCEYCRKVFYDRKLLKEHEIKHKPSKLSTKLTCSQCKAYFFNQYDLELHENDEHIEESIDGCIDLKHCYSMLSSLLNMNILKFFMVRKENAMYSCCLCKLRTPDMKSYIEHLQKEKFKSYACENCYNVFTSKARLQYHLTKRVNLCKTYARRNLHDKACKKCHQIFALSTLKRHITTCNGMNCETCNISFETVDEYSNHLKFHVKSLQLSTCEFCHRQFVGDVALKKHFDRTHKDTLHLYKYKCKDCDQMFMHPKLLFAHYFTKHKDLQPYTCKICDKMFKIRKQFTIHIKIQHKSIGFVEFDENYHVFFNDKKSEKPFQPYPLIKTNEKGKPRSKKNVVDSTYIERTEIDEDCTDIEMLDKKCEASDTEVTDDDQNASETDIDKTIEKTTTNKSGNKIKPKIKNEKLEENNSVQDDFRFLNVTETEGDCTEAESSLLVKRKRKIKTNKPRKKVNRNLERDLSSDDSDVPLLAVKNKSNVLHLKSNRFNSLKRKKEKFICGKCNKNCYTYQNYHHHLSLHEKYKEKECIKCNEKFKSKSALAAHIQNAHSSSKLTETLKQLLERRKNKSQLPVDRRAIVDGIRKTIKKVTYEKSNDTTTLKPVNDKLSVKKFFENFTPETIDTGSKDMGISIKLLETTDIPKAPIIKMTRFCQEEFNCLPRPKMPVKFKDPAPQSYKVNIKLVPLRETQPILRFSNKIVHEDHTYEADTSSHHYEMETENSDDIPDRDESIPEVAEEVMLNSEPPEKQDTFILPDIPKEYSNVRIAHLQEQAPYYKIVKIDDVLNPTQKKDPVENKPPSKIELPDGTKLVTVNPLAHLMGGTSVDELFKSQKKYYETKPKDIKLAIAKALDVNRTKKKKVLPGTL